MPSTISTFMLPRHRQSPVPGQVEEPAEEPAHSQTQQDSGTDGYRNAHELRQIDTAALGHAGEGGKEDDDKDIIAGGSGENELGNAFPGTPALLHQADHPGHHHCRGHSPQHGAHDGGFQLGDAQQHGSKQDIGQDLKTGGQEGHEHRRTSHPAQVAEIQRKPRLDENDDECHLPQGRH